MAGDPACFLPHAQGHLRRLLEQLQIVLADIAGKAFHKWRRSRILPHLVAKARPSQMGGAARRSTDFGILAFRALADRSRMD